MMVLLRVAADSSSSAPSRSLARRQPAKTRRWWTPSRLIIATTHCSTMSCRASHPMLILECARLVAHRNVHEDVRQLNGHGDLDAVQLGSKLAAVGLAESALFSSASSRIRPKGPFLTVMSRGPR